MSKHWNSPCDLSLSPESFQKIYGRSKRLATLTLGCKVNQYETQAVTQLFEKAGYQWVAMDEPADVFLINTCTVTSMSDRKSRQMIRRARKLNPQAVIAVTGCYAQLSPEEVQKIEGVQVVAGTSERHRLVDAVQAVQPFQQSPVILVKSHEAGEAFETLSVNATREMTRAYVKIQDGCNQYCSYCIIPYARGSIRSRNPEEVVAEIKALIANGYQEVVLTGIHLASYGRETHQPEALIQLLEIIDQLPGLQRLRLGSLEPTLMKEDFVERLMNLKSLCHHFHLSLQSGCDETLKAMNRKYSTAEYRDAVHRIRKGSERAAITTDIIVGFPGELEEHFQETMRFVEETGFADIHVFRYSPREGTPAAQYPDQVNEEIKNRRSQELSRKATELKREYFRRFDQEVVEVLVEQRLPDEPHLMEGHTRNYVKVFIPFRKEMIHQLVHVRIEGILQDACRGQVVSKQVDYIT